MVDFVSSYSQQIEDISKVFPFPIYHAVVVLLRLHWLQVRFVFLMRILTFYLTQVWEKHKYRKPVSPKIFVIIASPTNNEQVFSVMLCCKMLTVVQNT